MNKGVRDYTVLADYFNWRFFFRLICYVFLHYKAYFETGPYTVFILALITLSIEADAITQTIQNENISGHTNILARILGVLRSRGMIAPEEVGK